MNKKVLIIGSSGGIGQALCNKFIEEKDIVYGLDIKKGNNEINFFQTNVCSEESIITSFNMIKEEVDYFDYIISAVGIYNMDSLLEISDNDLKKIIDINVLGIQRTIKIFFPLLKKDSKILITTSEVATYDPLPFNGIYAMSKSLLEKYAYSLRMEINKLGIKVITYRPGAVKTTLLNDSTTALDRFVGSTIIHKESSMKFKHIVDKVESKSITPERNARMVYRIVCKKHPRYSYSINRNIGLVLLNILPKRLQVYIITKIIK